jgi:hypothetical protein
LLKIPVRENRTPGSVRGQSGNWLSYRDDASCRYHHTNPNLNDTPTQCDVQHHRLCVDWRGRPLLEGFMRARHPFDGLQYIAK